MDRGYIKLYRKSQENHLWHGKRILSRWEAWVDLLFEAAWREHKTLICGRLVTVPRGSVIHSERTLSDRWRWSKTNVHRFIGMLILDSMVVKKSDHGIQMLSIVNYDIYQSSCDDYGPATDRQRTGNGPATDQTEEEKERKEEKDNMGTSASPTKSSSHKTFQKPTVEDVRAYCEERKNAVDPETFWNFYESKGWRVGKNKMQSWKACVHTWEKNERSSYGWRTEKAKESRKCSKCGSPWIQGQIECLQCGTRFS